MVKDLDFDEIDRAVNSVISNAPAGGGDTTPLESVPAVPSEPKPPTVLNTPRPLAARRSSGQFMDVVHPSSDMRRTPLEVPERSISVPSEPIPDMQPPVTTQEPAVPDNLQTVSEEHSTDAYDDADIDKISDDINQALGQTPDAALESPFISGTKVEKRPLGAFSTDPAIEVTETVESSEKTDFAPHPSADTTSSEADNFLPAELQDDLLKIEADSPITTDDVPSEAPEESVPPAENETPTLPTETTPDVETVKSEVETTTTPAVAESTGVEGPTSIVQQYKEQPNTGDQSTGAIYDTNSYHKALIHPIKKKSGWLWVLYIAILLVVGAAVGAAVFYFVIPLINGL